MQREFLTYSKSKKIIVITYDENHQSQQHNFLKKLFFIINQRKILTSVNATELNIYFESKKNIPHNPEEF
jgi:hypothetical protein